MAPYPYYSVGLRKRGLARVCRASIAPCFSERTLLESGHEVIDHYRISRCLVNVGPDRLRRGINNSSSDINTNGTAYGDLNADQSAGDGARTDFHDNH